MTNANRLRNLAVDTDIDKLTREIVNSYTTDERTRRIGDCFLPSRLVIVETLEQIRQLLFPGYFGAKELTWQNVQFHVGSLVARIGSALSEQVYYCMCAARHCAACRDSDSCRQEAQRMARDFLARISSIRRALALDAQAAFDGDPAAQSIDEVIYCYPGFAAVTVYRVAHELLVVGVPLMSRIMTEYAHGLTGVDIHPGATIGKSFFIDHATGVVIGETARIGDNVKIYQGVTLGAKSFPKDERGRLIKGLKRHPTIEDNVTIYANATILGGRTVIGEAVTVSGNTFIQDSITADSLVMQKAPQLEVHRKTRPAAT